MPNYYDLLEDMSEQMLDDGSNILEGYFEYSLDTPVLLDLPEVESDLNTRFFQVVEGGCI